jgi:hypothetical protein
MGYLAGPLNSLAGRVITALNKSRAALTVMPIRRKGRRKNQTIGYNNRANIAKGQHKINNMNQRTNFMNIYPPCLSQPLDYLNFVLFSYYYIRNNHKDCSISTSLL